MCNPDGSCYCVWAYIYAALTTFTGTPLYAFLDVLKKKKIFHTLQSLSLSLSLAFPSTNRWRFST